MQSNGSKSIILNIKKNTKRKQLLNSASHSCVISQWNQNNFDVIFQYFIPFLKLFLLVVESSGLMYLVKYWDYKN